MVCKGRRPWHISPTIRQHSFRPVTAGFSEPYTYTTLVSFVHVHQLKVPPPRPPPLAALLAIPGNAKSPRRVSVTRHDCYAPSRRWQRQRCVVLRLMTASRCTGAAPVQHCRTSRGGGILGVKGEGRNAMVQYPGCQWVARRVEYPGGRHTHTHTLDTTDPQTANCIARTSPGMSQCAGGTAGEYENDIHTHRRGDKIGNRLTKKVLPPCSRPLLAPPPQAPIVNT